MHRTLTVAFTGQAVSPFAPLLLVLLGLQMAQETDSVVFTLKLCPSNFIEPWHLPDIVLSQLSCHSECEFFIIRTSTHNNRACFWQTPVTYCSDGQKTLVQRSTPCDPQWHCHHSINQSGKTSVDTLHPLPSVLPAIEIRMPQNDRVVTLVDATVPVGRSQIIGATPTAFPHCTPCHSIPVMRNQL